MSWLACPGEIVKSPPQSDWALPIVVKAKFARLLKKTNWFMANNGYYSNQSFHGNQITSLQTVFLSNHCHHDNVIV
jgi:hypothetical protein